MNVCKETQFSRYFIKSSEKNFKHTKYTYNFNYMVTRITFFRKKNNHNEFYERVIH